MLWIDGPRVECVYEVPLGGREDQLRDARAKVAALSPEASLQEIVEAHKRLIAMIHPDRGGTNEQVHEANAARDLLLDEMPDQK